MKNRVLYIDYMKALTMILVIMGHVNFANQEIKIWIYSFHMPVFFFCAGLVVGKGRSSAFCQSILNKFNRLMIPYFLWALLYAKFSIPNLLKITYGSYWSIVNAGTLTSLWFLPVMFLALFFFYSSIKLGLTNFTYRILFMVLAFILSFFFPHLSIGYPWSVNVAMMAFAMLLLGNISLHLLDKTYNYILLHKSVGFFVSSMLLILTGAGTLTCYLNTSASGYVLMANARYGFFYLFAFTAVCGILMVVFLSIILESLHKSGFRMLSFVGQNTLCIFVVHKPIISCVSVLFRFIPASNIVALFITTAITLLLSCFLCVVINKYAPVLAGKR